MGVDYKSNRLVSNRLESGQNLVPQRRVLIIDKDNPVVSDICSDVAVFASEQVDIARNSAYLNVDLVEVLLRINSGKTSAQQCEKNKRTFPHCRSPFLQCVIRSLCSRRTRQRSG